MCEGGSGLSYTKVDCMPDKGEGSPWAKVPRPGELSQQPGGGMVMLAGCAGLGEHGKEKDKSK